MKKSMTALILILLLATTLFPSSSEKQWAPENFKIMAYSSELPFNDPIDELQFEKLDHVFYAFLIPKSDGSLVPITKPDRLKELVREAHRNKVKVSIAIGGWSWQNVPLADTFESLAANPASRKRFIREVSDFVDNYKLDGVELDWEYPSVGESSKNYQALVQGLRSTLKPKGKLLSAAVSGSVTNMQTTDFSNGVSLESLQAFDWITVMAYDLYGAQHSPLWYAETSIAFWASRGMPREKIILGIPLYARPSWKQYRHLVAEDRGNAWRDYSASPPLESWYNGLGTISEKTRLALLKAGGIMFFDIHEDTADATSALSMADRIKKRAVLSDPAQLMQEVTCVMNSHEISFDRAEETGMPFISPESHLMLPVKKIMEAMGAQIRFVPSSETIEIIKDSNTMILPLRGTSITFNGSMIDLDAPPQIIKGRVYLPARTLVEPFGYKVEWLNNSRTLLMDASR